MNQDDSKAPRPLTRKKQLLFAAMIFMMCLATVEIGTRAILAFRVGGDVFFYGTPLHEGQFLQEKEIVEDKRTQKNNIHFHENERSNYSKYAPNEEKYDIAPVTRETFKVTINGQGFRGKDFSDRKEPGVIRVITLGASSTFGYLDRDNETYPVYLEALLNQRCKKKTFEVINLGIPHLKSEEILALFKAEALPLDPDVVTFYEGANDTAIMKTRPTAARSTVGRIKPIRTLYRAIRKRILILAFVDNLHSTHVQQFSEQYFQNHLIDRSETFVNNVAQIYEECKKRNIFFILAKQQAKSKMIPKEELKGITYAQEQDLVAKKLAAEGHVARYELWFLTHAILMKDIEKWTTDNQVPLVDTIEALDRDRDVLLSWVHLSPKGNRMIASALTEKILQHTCPEY